MINTKGGWNWSNKAVTISWYTLPPQSSNYPGILSPLKAPRSVRVNIQRLKYSIRHQHMYTVRCIRCNFTQVCDMYRSSSKIDILNTGENGQNVTYRTYIVNNLFCPVECILSCSFCPVLSCIVLSYPVLSWIVMSLQISAPYCPVVPCIFLFDPSPFFPCLTLDCPILSRIVLSCRKYSYPVSFL